MTGAFGYSASFLARKFAFEPLSEKAVIEPLVEALIDLNQSMGERLCAPLQRRCLEF